MKQLLFILILLSSKIAISQNLFDIEFEPLDEKNGLSNNWITNIILDSSGFLWIGTYDGLNRYDGHSFKVFKHDDKIANSLLHNNGQRISVTKKGDIWISYSEGGFSLYDKNCQCFIHFNSPLTKPIDEIDRDFGIKYIDDSGNLWFSGSGLGLNKYLFKQNKLEHFDLPFTNLNDSLNIKNSKNTVNSIYQSPDGMLWLCSENGLYSFDKKSNSFSYKKFEIEQVNIRSKHNFNKIIPEGNIGFWISSFDGGINYFDLKSEKFTNYSFDTKQFGFYNLVYDMAVKNSEEFWVIAGDKGLGVFNKTKGSFEFNTFLINNDGSKFSFLEQIIITAHHEIFISDETTLLKYSPTSKLFNFKYLPIASSQHGNLFAIRKVLENPSLGEIYFATDYGNGLNILNTNTQQLTALKVDVNMTKDKKIRLQNLIKDDRGKMWLLTRDFLYEFNPNNKRLIKIDSPFKNDEDDTIYNFKNFIQNNLGEIWVSTQEGKIYPFSSTERKLLQKLQIIDKQQNEIHNVNYALFDAFNCMWVFGDSQIAYRKNGYTNFNFIKDNTLLQILNHEIKATAADENGNIWVAIYNQGLLKINTKNLNQIRYTLFKSPNSIPTSRINNMGIDPYNNIWMSTINGIVYFNSTTNSYKIYNQTVGVPKYIFGMRFIKAGENSFYIATPGKYCKVDFDKLLISNPIPKVYIDRINIAKVQIPIYTKTNTIFTLKPTENYFSFDFGCIDFSSQAYHQFYYQLEGWDKNWQEAGIRRFANYTNVSGGKYTFKVKVMNGEGQWSESAKFSIYIQTPFYKSWWFRLLIILFISVILFMIYKYRLHQHRQVFQLKGKANLLEKEKTMMMYESLKQQLNPHFLFNSLTSLSGLIETDQEMAVDFLEQMSGIYRYILKSEDAETVTLKEELEFVSLYIKLQQTRFKSGLLIHIEIGEDHYSERIAPVTLQNLIENAIKHNIIDSATPLCINIFIEDEYIVVKNNLQLKNKVETSNNKGLAQFKIFYAFLSEKSIVIENSDSFFIIKIPLI